MGADTSEGRKLHGKEPSRWVSLKERQGVCSANWAVVINPYQIRLKTAGYPAPKRKTLPAHFKVRSIKTEFTDTWNKTSS